MAVPAISLASSPISHAVLVFGEPMNDNKVYKCSEELLVALVSNVVFVLDLHQGNTPEKMAERMELSVLA